MIKSIAFTGYNFFIVTLEDKRRILIDYNLKTRTVNGEIIKTLEAEILKDLFFTKLGKISSVTEKEEKEILEQKDIKALRDKLTSTMFKLGVENDAFILTSCLAKDILGIEETSFFKNPVYYMLKK